MWVRHSKLMKPTSARLATRTRKRKQKVELYYLFRYLDGKTFRFNGRDLMLSELASGGHLLIESEDNALFYRLPGRRTSELQGRG